MAEQNGIYSDNANDCVDRVIERVGKRITLGLPLGLGKPVRFVNALYQRAKDDPEIQLHIVTALSLLAPEGDRKSTRLNSSHVRISYAVFCLKKKKTIRRTPRIGKASDERRSSVRVVRCRRLTVLRMLPPAMRLPMYYLCETDIL